MSKQEISWTGLVTKLSKEAKSAGKASSLKDVMSEAKKIWVSIKNGTHSKYKQGKPPKRTRKKGKKKTKGTKSRSFSKALKKCDICKECRDKVEKCLESED